MALVPWTTSRGVDRFGEMVDMRDRIDRLFEEYFGQVPAIREDALGRNWAPAVDIYEDKDNIIVKAELPGIKKEDLSIDVKNNVLTLSGERKHEKETKKENFHRMERSYGKFSRSFTLPNSVKVEKVKAQYKDGILDISLPKTEKAKTKAIPINVE